VGGVTNAPADREIIAVIAYLQRLGTDIKVAAPPVAAEASTPVNPVASVPAPETSR